MEIIDGGVTGIQVILRVSIRDGAEGQINKWELKRAFTSKAL